MKKTIYNKYDKKLIPELPVATFEGRIEVVFTEAEAEKAVDFLLQQDILGFDTETRPAFKRGQMFRVGLLQVSARNICFLFRLNLIGLCPAVVRLLEDNTVTKVGLSWHDDLRVLHRRGDFNAGEFVELQTLVKDIGVEDLSLQKLYANLFGEKISKRQRLTNWDAPTLNDAQKKYAAFDAYACILLYEEIMRLKSTHDYDLVVIPEPEPPLPTPEELEAKARKAAEKKARLKEFQKKRKSATRKTVRKKKNNDIQESISQEG